MLVVEMIDWNAASAASAEVMAASEPV